MNMELHNIQKNYKKKQVLRAISLQTNPGCCIGILGGNGSGKSTLLSILAGVQSCNNGSFLWKGIDLLKDGKARAELVGYVPQGTPLLEELTAWDNLLLWYDKKTLKQELKNGVLAMLGIGEFLKTPVNKMSGGMKKRVSIGCSVARKPQILLLDEPTAALDLVCKAQIYRYLADYKKRGGIIVLATHDVQELALCDVWYILKDGVLAPYQYDGNIQRLAEYL